MVEVEVMGSVVSLSVHVVECGDVRGTQAVNAHRHHPIGCWE